MGGTEYRWVAMLSGLPIARLQEGLGFLLKSPDVGLDLLERPQRLRLVKCRVKEIS